jgi:uncharacterized protein (DUF1778 family)
MPETDNNGSRLTARIPSQVRETLQRAATLSGATLNQFLVQAALKEAHRVLEEERIITLSECDALRVFTLLENPHTKCKVAGGSKKTQGFSVKVIELLRQVSRP